jgi:hypothetical protein
MLIDLNQPETHRKWSQTDLDEDTGLVKPNQTAP